MFICNQAESQELNAIPLADSVKAAIVAPHMFYAGKLPVDVAALGLEGDFRRMVAASNSNAPMGEMERFILSGGAR